MNSKFKIGIIGLGGVGGFLGAKLALHFAGSQQTEINFIARGENEKAISANGLKLITKTEERTAFPFRVTSQPELLGKLNLILYCVKSYGLDEAMESLHANVSDETIILPFLNGVDTAERIQKKFPQAQVWDGCVYIVSRLIAPGVVKETGNTNVFYFGSRNVSTEALKKVEALLVAAGVHAIHEDDILKTVWEKFLFISPIATLTSYADCVISELLESEEKRKMLTDLVVEVSAVAKAKGISFPYNSAEKVLKQAASVPAGNTSSMHSDFKKGGKTELESLTGYVIKEAKAFGLQVPVYSMMYEKLLSKSPTIHADS